MDIIVQYYMSHFDDNQTHQSDFTCFVSCSIDSLLLTSEEVTHGLQIYTRKMCRKINLYMVFFKFFSIIKRMHKYITVEHWGNTANTYIDIKETMKITCKTTPGKNTIKILVYFF